jgi:hypothetical protein
MPGSYNGATARMRELAQVRMPMRFTGVLRHRVGLARGRRRPGAVSGRTAASTKSGALRLIRSEQHNRLRASKIECLFPKHRRAKRTARWSLAGRSALRREYFSSMPLITCSAPALVRVRENDDPTEPSV